MHFFACRIPCGCCSFRSLVSGPSLSSNDRSGLVDDALAFALYGPSYLPIATAMDFIGFLPQESSYAVWDSAIGRLNALYGLLFPDDLSRRRRLGRLAVTGAAAAAEEDCISNFEEFMQELLDNAIAAVGWDESPNDSPQTIFARSLLLSTGSYYGHK